MAAQKEDRRNLTQYDYNDQQQNPANPPAPPAYFPAHNQSQYQPPYQPPAITMVSAPTTNVVVGQCRPMLTYVPDYMAWSILNLLFCCLPLGLVAIIFSAITRDHRWSGDTESARKNSRIALGLNVAATIGGVITMIVVGIVVTNLTHQQESEFNRIANNYVQQKNNGWETVVKPSTTSLPISTPSWWIN